MAKEIKTTLENLQEKLEAQIDTRDAIMDNRSENWQESEKADEYQSKTEILNDVMDNIAYAIESLDEYLEN